jgi:predicted O-methyltransferase YrrM
LPSKTLADLSYEQQVIRELEYLNSFEHPAESAVLFNLARGQAVLEIGTLHGYSAILMSRTATVVHTVDWHRGSKELGELDTLATAWRNIREAGADNVVMHVGRSCDVLPYLSGPFGLVFIDGSHEYEDVITDLDDCVNLLRCKTLLVHDYRGYPGVTKAVDEVLASHPGSELTRPAGSLALLSIASDMMRA